MTIQNCTPCMPVKAVQAILIAVATWLVFIAWPAETTAQQQPANTELEFQNIDPAYADKSGPVVRIHRYVSPYVQRGLFDAFKQLIEGDGFRTEWLDKQLSQEALDNMDVLVVANAYTRGGARDFRNFSTLEAPSVYSEAEIEMIATWVRKGGSLLILADHSPFAGGTIKLAEAFGFTYMTGIALDKRSLSENIISNIDFRRSEGGSTEAGGREIAVGRLSDHAIVDGGLGREKISHFFAFEGQAIIPPPEATSLLVLPNGFETILTYSLFNEFFSAPRLDVSGLSQGAVMQLGEGRIAIFGETGGFTVRMPEGLPPSGFSSPEADENADFILSTLRWLANFTPE